MNRTFEKKEPNFVSLNILALTIVQAVLLDSELSDVSDLCIKLAFLCNGHAEMETLALTC